MINSGRQSSTAAGFTLIELLVVSAILAILMAVAVPKFMETLKTAQVGKAIADIATIRDVVEFYRAQNNGNIPTNMAALVPGSIGGALYDPWGNPYVFSNFKVVPPAAQRLDLTVPINREYDIYSDGPNGSSFADIRHGSSKDDIIMANDGSYIGVAKDY